jgi:chromosome segregation ATPase
MVIGDAIYHPEWALDAELIAASRNALPELLDELERLRAEASAGEEYRDILRSERDEARAEVARLQEELKQAQSATFTSERFRAEDAWSHNGDLIVTVKDRDHWKQEAGYNAALADSFQQQVIKLEAEAQALRAGLTEALEHYGNLAYSELKPSPYYDREEAKITRLLALLSPAQEAPK